LAEAGKVEEEEEDFSTFFLAKLSNSFATCSQERREKDER
jgi:hypothetical protein